MMYEIQERSTLQGMSLVIRFPEEALDEKAYYTIEGDMPEFLVPFHCHSVDGKIECTYYLGNLLPLKYNFGSHQPREYVAFWNKVLRPLLDCEDWFLNPFSFVMDCRYLYADKDGKRTYYLYIPAKNVGTYDDLKAMAIELAQQNHTADAKMENQALLSIMQDFRPQAFLRQLQSSCPVSAPIETPLPSSVEKRKDYAALAAPMPELEHNAEGISAASPVNETGDFVIDLNGQKKKKAPKNEAEKQKKESAKENKSGEKGGLFKKKKEKSKEILVGAVAAAADSKQKEIPAVGRKQIPNIPVMAVNDETQNVTVLDNSMGGPRLRLNSSAPLPPVIAVTVRQGRPFVIGRFDVSVGHQQCDFEFEKRTKAVSRRHAAIEQCGREYLIYDLSSSAGTFVDGERLIPNVPRPLENGSRISFGTSGADYIWEV